jgi:hypothetical protein
MTSPCCLCVCVSVYPTQSSECLNQSLWNLSPSQRRTSQIPPISILCLYVYPPSALLGKDFGMCLPSLYLATNICNNRIVGNVVFYAVRVVSKESLWVCLSILLSLLGNGSVNMFQRQQRQNMFLLEWQPLEMLILVLRAIFRIQANLFPP